MPPRLPIEDAEKNKWLNRGDMAVACGVSNTAFDRWKVKKAAIIGAQTFYSVRDVIDNRVAHALNRYAPPDPDDGEDGGLNLDALRADKLREEAQRLRLQNAILEGRSIPADAVTEILTRILAESVQLLDTLPLHIKRRHQELDARVISYFEEAIAKARNSVADLDRQIERVLDEVIAEAESRT